MLLYIHIPFCDSKCFYCSFNSYTNLFHLKTIYMEKLAIQLKQQLTQTKTKKLKSIFIGGGTPSCINADYYEPIFTILKPYISNTTEITTEANPNSASKQWLSQMKNLGINRVSFGVQSFDNNKLKFLGRSHNKIQAIQAINNAKELGFIHINCDIIYDTQLDTKQLIQNDLDIIQTLPIDHISAYSLTIEEGTKFFTKPQVKVDNIDLANYIFNRLNSFGFTQYEISNFAKNKNAQSIHNFGYWEKEDYFGIGAGAVGTINNTRYYPYKDIQQYINNPLGYEQIEHISQDDSKFETIFLGLRSAVGVDLNIFTPKEQEKINILINQNKLKIHNNKIYNLDFMITDELVLFITE